MLIIFKACNSGVVQTCCPIPTIHLTNLACSLSNSFLWHPYNKLFLQVADHTCAAVLVARPLWQSPAPYRE